MVNRIHGKRDKVKKKSNFVYRKRAEDEVKARAEQNTGRFDNPWVSQIDTFRPTPGDNLVRILPPPSIDYKHYGHEVWMHGFVGPNKSSYVCPAHMKKKKCPICEAAADAAREGDKEEARALSAQKKVVCWVIDRDAEDETPKLWVMSANQDKDIAMRAVGKRGGPTLLIDDPEQGYDVSIQRQGQGLKTRYTLSIERSPSAISDDEDKQEEILNFVTENPLHELPKLYSADFLDNIISGTAEEKDEDLDDDDEKPVKKKAKSKAKSKASDDDDEEEVDEDDEDEKPARKSSSRRRPVEDEDEDEDEEDEKPVKARRRPSREDDEDEDDEPVKPRRKAPKDEDEEEEEPEEDFETEDEEEEEKPVRRRVKVEEPEDEEGEEDEPEEDEDEDAAPRKKNARKPAAKARRRDDEDEDEEDVEDADEDEEDEVPRKAARKKTRGH